MNDVQRASINKFCVWCGVAFLVLIGGGFIFLAGFFPPVSPSLSAADIQQVFVERATGIRFSMILLMVAACCFVAFITVTADYVSRFEGRAGTLTMLVGFSGVLNCMAFVNPAIWWLTAAFRPDRAPELIQIANDMAWFQFLGFVTAALMFMMVCAAIAFIDKRSTPLFPRWFGYFNLWMVLVIIPGQLLFFFVDGLFAWDGLFGFWLPAIDFFVQLILCIYFVWKAADRDLMIAKRQSLPS